MALLDVQQLRVTLHSHRSSVAAVRDVSFSLNCGEILGVIGESGCGKSMTALALMGLAPENATVSGSVLLHGQELVGLAKRQWQRLRGARISMIFQEPMTALNPVHRIGNQIAEPLKLHRKLSSRQARECAIALLERVGIAEAGQRIDSYPHQLSGGQRQRIMIAMALACEPDVVLADEPTTALDVTVQQQILRLIRELAAERHIALMLISHNLGLMAQNAHRVLVMYGGTVVELGLTSEIFHQPIHPYTRGLLSARPHLPHRLVASRQERLPIIVGNVPNLFELPAGCPFAGRCALTQPICAKQIPPNIALSATHQVRCHHIDHLLEIRPSATLMASPT